MYVWAKRIFIWLGSPAMVFYVMPLYMAVIIAGTIAQKHIGLYQSLRLYFASPLFLALTAILTIGLLFRFIFHSEWRLHKAGIHLAHLGVLILLGGGFLAGITAREGFLVIPEGEARLFVSDYHQRALLIVKNGDVYTRLAHQKIKRGAAYEFPDIGLRVDIVEHCRNCKISERDTVQDHYRGMARFMVLSESAALEQDDEKNLYGATLKISGAGGAEQDGVYVVFEAMPEPIRLDNNAGDTIEIIYGKAQRALPFAVRLDDFAEDVYEGTQKARSFHSDITVIEPDGLEWPVRIEMNKPLRYKGYTLYQTSFIREADGGEITILAVVENQGWLTPYIGTILMAIGLLWHSILVVWKRGRRQ